MKKNSFKKFRTRGVSRKEVDTLAGHKYLERADIINEEIAFINRKNANACKNADMVFVFTN